MKSLDWNCYNNYDSHYYILALVQDSFLLIEANTFQHRRLKLNHLTFFYKNNNTHVLIKYISTLIIYFIVFKYLVITF